MPIAVLNTVGASAFWLAESCGLCLATYSSRKSYQRLKVAGSSESMCAPFVNVNHLRLVPLKCSARSAQGPPVCSSVHWQARNEGTSILCTKVIGESGSATLGT